MQGEHGLAHRQQVDRRLRVCPQLERAWAGPRLVLDHVGEIAGDQLAAEGAALLLAQAQVDIDARPGDQRLQLAAA